MMSERKKIGLFYGSSTCYTEMAGEKIRDTIGEQWVDVFNIADTPIIETQFYNYLILGIPTWDYGELQEDWEEIWDEIDELDLNNKKVALYGLGDQIGYPEWFLDAMGYLYHKIRGLGAITVGSWPNQGYQFEGSKALTDDQKQFFGLALDDENQFDQTQTRIDSWCQQILQEFAINENHS